MSIQLTILGSGTSHGVPMIGCDCAVCTSTDERDRRSRPSALLDFDSRRVLIDTSPELRLQCLRCDVRCVDAILFTHAHADHVAGLDDVRVFNQRLGRDLPVYASEDTLEHVTTMFAYAFRKDKDYPSAKPELTPIPIREPFDLFGRTITPIPYSHGTLEVFGYRAGGIAYCPDCSFIPDASRELLRDLDVLVLDGLRRTPHPTHFSIAQAVEEARRIDARRTYFTHIAHELKHAETNAELPDTMELAYDGLVCAT